MKFLFFDCETTGKPIDYRASYEDVNNWPRVISLAWILADLSGTVYNSQHHLIKPDGWQMPTGEFWITNGFSHEENMQKGIAIKEVLQMFMADKLEAAGLVAHNLNFDHRIVWAEFIRAAMPPRSGMKKYCTMMLSTRYCNLPGTRGPKWPKLEELHHVLFKKQMEGAHNAKADVQACMNCFVELVRLGVIPIETEPVNN
jgi:DNA polymerase III epsilon subunit-like protein